MDFALTPQPQALRDRTRAFIAEQVIPMPATSRTGRARRCAARPLAELAWQAAQRS